MNFEHRPVTGNQFISNQVLKFGTNFQQLSNFFHRLFNDIRCVYFYVFVGVVDRQAMAYPPVKQH